MGRLGSTLALLAVLLGLGAYIYFGLPAETDEALDPGERVFAGVESDQIGEVTVRSASGEVTTVTKDGEEWAITAPLAARADASEVSSITSNLASLAISRVVEEKPADLKQYGLDPPRLDIAFTTAGSADGNNGTHRLLVGETSPTGGDVFARREGDPRVILIPGYLDPIFNRTTFNLRDKSLVAFDRDKVDRVTVTAGSRSVELVRDGSDWRLTKPVEAAADTVMVDALIGRVHSAAMTSIVTDAATAGELSQYGLDRPQAVVTMASGDETASIAFGGEAGESELYARDPARPLVATVGAEVLTDVVKEADEYRRRELMAFRGYSGNRIEFTREGATVAFEKVTSDTGAETWRRVSPTVGEPDATSMQTLLTRLEMLRAESFDATVPPGAPFLTVVARSDEGAREERVSLWRTGDSAFATVPGQPAAVTVSASAVDEIVAALDPVSK